MDEHQIVQIIRQFCKENACEEIAKKSARYFKDEFHGYGLTTDQIRIFVKVYLKESDPSLIVLMEAAPALVESIMFEETILILLLINARGSQYTRKIFEEIGGFYKAGITNWAHADTLGMYILPQFLKRKIVEVNDFRNWITSPYKFQRRSVPVTLIKYLKEHRTDDFRPIFLFIEPLMMDKEREVHQGVGWFLREAWKIQRDTTEEFLLKWKETAPRLIIQYATEKMTQENKARFKRSK